MEVLYTHTLPSLCTCSAHAVLAFCIVLLVLGHKWCCRNTYCIRQGWSIDLSCWHNCCHQNLSWEGAKSPLPLLLPSHHGLWQQLLPPRKEMQLEWQQLGVAAQHSLVPLSNRVGRVHLCITGGTQCCCICMAYYHRCCTLTGFTDTHTLMARCQTVRRMNLCVTRCAEICSISTAVYRAWCCMASIAWPGPWKASPSSFLLQKAAIHEHINLATCRWRGLSEDCGEFLVCPVQVSMYLLLFFSHGFWSFSWTCLGVSESSQCWNFSVYQLLIGGWQWNPLSEVVSFLGARIAVCLSCGCLWMLLPCCLSRCQSSNVTSFSDNYLLEFGTPRE